MREFTLIGGPCDGVTIPYSERIEQEGTITYQAYSGDDTLMGGEHVYRVSGDRLIHDPKATAERRARTEAT